VGSYYVQTGFLSWTPVVASLPVGLLMFCMLLINEIPDIPADKKTGKNTIPVKVGSEKASKVFSFVFVLAYLSIVIPVFFSLIPVCCLAGLATIPLARQAVQLARQNHDKPENLGNANLYTYLTHLLTGLMLVFGFTVCSFWV
jgi:1,4-dihydroxy-2-naphthoate octaprenyltransferase